MSSLIRCPSVSLDLHGTELYCIVIILSHFHFIILTLIIMSVDMVYVSRFVDCVSVSECNVSVYVCLSAHLSVQD